MEAQHAEQRSAGATSRKLGGSRAIGAFSLEVPPLHRLGGRQDPE